MQYKKKTIRIHIAYNRLNAFTMMLPVDTCSIFLVRHYRH